MTDNQAPKEIWLIVGASSAIARAVARQFAESGNHLVLAGRDQEDLQRLSSDLRVRGAEAVSIIDLDIRSAKSRQALITELVTIDGNLNVFIAVGTMPAQSMIDSDPELIDDVVATNLTGIAILLTVLAPRLETQGRGHVIVVGSVAGDRGRLKNYTYGASKAGLHTWLQGYRARLHRSGVGVLTVKPGFLDTAMSWGLGPLPLALSPDAFATKVVQGSRAGRDVLYVPWIWRWIMMIIRIVPERWFKRTDI